jgi:hypothetical protein
MDDRLERWTVMAFDDAAARIALPPREHWLPAQRRSSTSLATVALTAAVLALAVGAALWLVSDDRLVPAAPSAKPTPANLIRLAPGGTEAQTWGKVFSVSMGATVLRPTWLPVTDLDSSYDVMTTSRGLYRYVVGYYPKNVFPPGPRPPHLLFIAEGPDVLKARPAAGDSVVTVTLRGGLTGDLITASDGEQRVIWMENDIRYTIQAAVGIPAADVLRIAESLAVVIDPDGTTR